MDIHGEIETSHQNHADGDRNQEFDQCEAPPRRADQPVNHLDPPEDFEDPDDCEGVDFEPLEPADPLVDFDEPELELEEDAPVDGVDLEEVDAPEEEDEGIPDEEPPEAVLELLEELPEEAVLSSVAESSLGGGTPSIRLP